MASHPNGAVHGFQSAVTASVHVSLAMARNVSGGYFARLHSPSSVVAAFYDPSDWVSTCIAAGYFPQAPNAPVSSRLRLVALGVPDAENRESLTVRVRAAFPLLMFGLPQMAIFG